MPRDGREITIYPSGQEINIFKRAGDTLIYNLDFKPTLGPEGWLNSFYLEGQETSSGPGTTILNAITEVDSTHLFQVGYYVDAGGRKKPLIQVGNGTTWTNKTADGTAIPAVPQLTSGGSTADAHTVLTCCTAVSTTEYYAFGYYYDSNPTVSQLAKVYHLKSTDGGATWAYISASSGLPTQPGTALGLIDRVTTFCVALSTGVIVYGGNVSRVNSFTSQTTLYTWKASITGGTTFGTMAANGTGGISQVVADTTQVITCAVKVSSTVAYIAGYQLAANGSKQTLAYTTADSGATFTALTPPNDQVASQAVDNTINGCAVSSATEIYFVGSSVTNAQGLRKNLVLKFDGTTWTKLTSPVVPQTGLLNNELTACTIDNPGNTGAFLYCGGYFTSNTAPNLGNRAQVLRYNTTTPAWTTQTIVNPSTGSESISGLASAGVGEVWLCGTSGGAALSEHFTSSWATVATTAPIANVAPPVLTPFAIVLPASVVAPFPPAGSQTTGQFRLSGGTSGWVGSARLFTGISYPRDNAQLNANAYVKYVLLHIEIL